LFYINYCRIGTSETSHDSYQENILESIKIETELPYKLSVAESDCNSVKINKITTFDNIQQIIDGLNKTGIIGENPVGLSGLRIIKKGGLN